MKLTHNAWVVILIWLFLICLPIGISKLIVFIANQSIPPSPAQPIAQQPARQIAERIATTTEEIISVIPAGTSTVLTASHWVPQTLNNCGPATTVMLLQHFGYAANQKTVRANLHKHSWDKNTHMYEIRDYLKDKYGISSKWMYNGTVDIVKTLLANGFYVMVEGWARPGEDVGHLSLIRGYDDGKKVFIADDSLLGIGVLYPYATFVEKQWKIFNYEYLPVYAPEQEPIVKKIIGADWDEQVMYQNAITRNQADAARHPHDPYPWFNIGTSYFGLGEYEKAKIAFETSRAIGWPSRMLWYQIQPIQNYNRLKEYKKALELIAVGLKNNESFAELYEERAIAYAGLGDAARAKDAAETAVRLAPESTSAKNLLLALQSPFQ
ncbi:C39 family peptidase [Patescibacteria group bacterium]|nr:C39 family peptidase [Patescibacteria group bacterium]